MMTKPSLPQIIQKAIQERATTLDLSQKGLTMLPPGLEQLRQLRELNLNGNQLTQLPSTIAKLRQLQELYLRDNRLTQLPPAFGQLKQLQRLDLRNNQLTQFPPELGQLTQLQELNFGRNQLIQLPPELGQLTQLRWLYLDGNQLTQLPPELGKLTQLQRLDLRGNHLPLPPEISKKVNQPTEILNYYFNVLNSRPLHEAKMLLVGQGGVGKTSLANRLLHNTYNDHEAKTDGIAITQWSVTTPKNDSIRLNLWDFGGQEIMHATHQFFLTKRSLYILVLDARQGEQESRVEYWLKLIQSFGGDSPILVAINKSDEHRLEINRKGLMSKYPTIQTFFEISCKTGAGLNDLTHTIEECVNHLPHVHDPFPANWFSIKNTLRKMQQDYLSYEEYQRLCKQEGITDDLSQRTLIGFLHDLGMVLNFRDDPLRPQLAETNILNPQWVTQGVYKLLNDSALVDKKGVLAVQQLSFLLDPQRYPLPKQRLIMELMEKFELCFAFEQRQRFLIPELLPKEEPDLTAWQQDNPLRFEYHYDVLPASVISRFIVRLHEKIWKKTYWRTGVVLAMDNNQALVKADIEDKKIFIWVTGNDHGKRALLAVIRSQFDQIHKSIPKIQAIEQVPHKHIVIPYFDLLKLEEKGYKKYFVPAVDEEVDVVKLLDGIEARRLMEDLDDFTSLENKVSQLAKSLPQGEAKEWCEELKKAIHVARIDLQFAIPKGRQILETIVAKVYQDTFPQEHRGKKHSGKINDAQLFSMIEKLAQVDNLFSGAVIADMNYVRITGNLVVHKQDQKIDLTLYNVHIALLMVTNLVEWYLHK
jgi:internalin A